MAHPHPELSIGVFHRMATHWPEWRRRLARSRSLAASTERIGALASISQHQGTWELAMSIAAYAALRSPRIVAQRPGTDMSIIANALLTLPGREQLPGFADVAGAVALQPLGKLIRSAPRLARMLRDAETLTAASVACAEFCLDRYKDDPVGMVNCLREC